MASDRCNTPSLSLDARHLVLISGCGLECYKYYCVKTSLYRVVILDVTTLRYEVVRLSSRRSQGAGTQGDNEHSPPLVGGVRGGGWNCYEIP